MFSVFINKIDLLQFILLISQNSIIFIIIILISNVAYVSFVSNASRFTLITKGSTWQYLRRRPMRSRIKANGQHCELAIRGQYIEKDNCIALPVSACLSLH